MTPRDPFPERRLTFTGDPIAVGAALCAATEAPHLLYEQSNSVVWSEGESAVVEVGASSVRLYGKGVAAADLPAGTHPLSTAGELLQALSGGVGSAHGWLSFELTHAYQGGETPEGAALARFVVPEREIELTASSAVLRAADPDALDDLERRLRTAMASAGRPTAARIAVDLEEHADRYRTAVADVVCAIRAGELDKVIVSRSVSVPQELDLPATYVAGRRGHLPARSFLLRHGGWEAAGFSPEIVARVDAEGVVTAQPLAGTRALTGDPEGDAARRAELCRDAKEVHEHAVSVRLVQEELHSVCLPESVCIEEFMAVAERGSVQHLASRLRGRLAPGRDRWDALAALFPAVTASGIPKRPALAVVHRAEQGGRGLYSGAVVRLEADGTLDAALVLRTVLRRDGRTWLRAGAGIVAGSDPERELEETREKLRAVSSHLVPVAPVEVSEDGTVSEDEGAAVPGAVIAS
ncbi:salicylate synthase [Streptomyces sp. ISID311]|uniref:salicylate synthase n=1 Tax=Streptomyces sp. ISID311 TaxID=2601673 RepID=UPI0011BD3AF0|nr:salicylate synthase [Streptomyces sp. ISID311]TXC99829.1 salicylate synthase [Streptomyces sp. ISID311]